MLHRSEITSFCFGSDFFANEGSQNMFFRSQNSATSKTPGNFRKRTRTSQKTRGTSLKHPGTSETHPELPKHTRNFPNTPGTSQKHPELPRTSRELPKTPGELPNTRGTSQKHPGRWWVVGGWVGSHNTRGRSYGLMGRTATWHI